jgi:hypothetical protein
MKTIFEGRNYHHCTAPGSMSLCIHMHFLRCYWPALDEPTDLFAEGSRGLVVQGPPTPRNVVFPPDTVFLPVVVNDAALGEPPRWRVTDVPTKSDCYFLRDEELAEEMTIEQARAYVSRR